MSKYYLYLPEEGKILDAESEDENELEIEQYLPYEYEATQAFLDTADINEPYYVLAIYYNGDNIKEVFNNIEVNAAILDRLKPGYYIVQCLSPYNDVDIQTTVMIQPAQFKYWFIPKGEM